MTDKHKDTTGGEDRHRHGGKKLLGTVLRFLVPLAVTVGLCWLMFRNIDFREMLRIIREECDYGWIAGGLLLSVVSMWARAMRWRIQLRALGYECSRYALVLSVFGTYAINLVFPRLGEIWRSGYVAERQKAPFSTVFGSMVAERLSDTVVVGLFMLGAFLAASGSLMEYMHRNEESYHWAIALAESPWLWIGGIACLGLFVWALRAKARPGSFLARLQGFVKGLWQGFAVIATMKGKGRWLVYTALIWAGYYTQLYLAFQAFPFTREVYAQYGMTAVLVTYAISSVAMGVPSNGGIGPYQMAIIFALGIYGTGATDGAAFGNLVLGSQTVFVILLGLYTFIAIMAQRRRHGVDTPAQAPANDKTTTNQHTEKR